MKAYMRNGQTASYDRMFVLSKHEENVNKTGLGLFSSAVYLHLDQD